MPKNKSSAQINYSYAPMCDESVVRSLIENRLTAMSLAGREMNELMILTYIDLDRLLDQTKLSENEQSTVQLIMQGYTIADIVNEFGGQRQAYSMFYRRAIRKICDRSIALWEDYYGGQPAKGVCY